jgi:hypothetical protein
MVEILPVQRVCLEVRLQASDITRTCCAKREQSRAARTVRRDYIGHGVGTDENRARRETRVTALA